MKSWTRGRARSRRAGPPASICTNGSRCAITRRLPSRTVTAMAPCPERAARRVRRPARQPRRGWPPRGPRRAAHRACGGWERAAAGRPSTARPEPLCRAAPDSKHLVVLRLGPLVTPSQVALLLVKELPGRGPATLDEVDQVIHRLLARVRPSGSVRCRRPIQLRVHWRRYTSYRAAVSQTCQSAHCDGLMHRPGFCCGLGWRVPVHPRSRGRWQEPGGDSRRSAAGAGGGRSPTAARSDTILDCRFWIADCHARQHNA